MCPHTTIYVSAYYCARILLYMRSHSAVYLASAYSYICALILLCTSAYCYICVLILLYMCPHTAIFVSSRCYIGVLILLCVRILLYICVLAILPHITIYMCVRVLAGGHDCCRALLYMWPHFTTIYVSSYSRRYYIGVFTLLLYTCPHILYYSMRPHILY